MEDGMLKSKYSLLVLGLAMVVGAQSAPAQALSANCQAPFTDPRYNNRTNAEVTTQDFGCRIIAMAQQNLSPVDDFRAMCQIYGSLMDVNAVTNSINSDLNGVLPALRPSEAIGLLAAVTLHEMSFLREQRQFRNILDFNWILQPNGARFENGRRGVITRFRLRNMQGVGSTILYLNPQGRITNLSSSDAPFGATLVGTVPERIKNSNGGGSPVRPDIVASTISSYIGANFTGCPNL